MAGGLPGEIAVTTSGTTWSLLLFKVCSMLLEKLRKKHSEMMMIWSPSPSETKIWGRGKSDEKRTVAVRVCELHQTTRADPPRACLQRSRPASYFQALISCEIRCGLLPRAPFPLHIPTVPPRSPWALGLSRRLWMGREDFQFGVDHHLNSKKEPPPPFIWKQN